MTDLTLGAQDAPDENALFNDAVTSDTLDKFENPPVATEPKPAPTPAAGEPPKPDARTEPKLDETIPSGRLREESEARRRAERERDDLRAQMAMLARQQPQQQRSNEPQKIDLFENPSGSCSRSCARIWSRSATTFKCSERRCLSTSLFSGMATRGSALRVKLWSRAWRVTIRMLGQPTIVQWGLTIPMA